MCDVRDRINGQSEINLAKKALLVTTVSGFVPQFEMSNVRILQDLGCEVHYAANYNTPSYGTDNHRLEGTGIIQHQIDFVRSPFQLQSITIYKQLKKLMQTEHFDLVHCHTPMGGVMARIAARSTKTAPVVYTAHGFHFYTGASMFNWLFYYPVEKFLSHFTDEQICINKEDYERAKKKFHAKCIDYIPGVGINIEKIQKDVDIKLKKEELGLPIDKTIILSSGEMIKRKNHETAIRAIALLKQFSNDFHYVICGHGELSEYLHDLAEKLHVSDSISFLGYRKDMMEIFQVADLFLFPSYQEGLPMALLEAMAYGLPIVCSDIRGNSDLMGQSTEQLLNYCEGGIMVKKADDVSAYSQAIYSLLGNKSLIQKMGDWNSIRAKEFDDKQVKAAMKIIYRRLLS
ncbi:glycosyltransferase family 4 protein [Lacrimispora sp.]|jgi:glycosyltransferase involved in cell wall biosynthesis|uniref:glycosyltransferase family 4 protein n=1 Tax=Lacrimispora sp. TaxID=2719234 RepID=UPI0028AF4200|nr:glycosyltransferase family 4 protein [Lacrimispora sp.]